METAVLGAVGGAAVADGGITAFNHGLTTRHPTAGGYVIAGVKGAVEGGVLTGLQTYAIANGPGARCQPGVGCGQPHQERSETGVDIPVRRGPPRVGPVRDALVGLGYRSR